MSACFIALILAKSSSALSNKGDANYMGRLAAFSPVINETADLYRHEARGLAGIESVTRQ
jgi:uncharacterized protein YegP (UPF0339 family)